MFDYFLNLPSGIDNIVITVFDPELFIAVKFGEDIVNKSPAHRS